MVKRRVSARARPKIAPRILRYATSLEALHKAGAQVRRSVLSRGKREIVLVLVECARMLIRNKRRLTEGQLRKLRAKTEQVYDLINPRTSLARRRQILQTGGFIGALLSPVLSLLSPILRGVAMVSGAGRRRRRR